MCGRTSLAVPVGDLEERFDATAVTDFPPRYNIAPGDDLASIRNDSPARIDRLEWGLIPHWANDPDDVPTPINARSETVAEKPMFRDAFEERRCLILADGFYEWKGKRGRKQPYRIERTDGAPYAYAGLWDTWSSDGEERATCTILTTDANEAVRDVHDRMPVMLERDEERVWLEADDPDDALAVFDPYPSEALRVYPISTAVNDPKNDSPALLEPVDVGEQSEIGEYGG